jgi:hypothetical protein
MKIEAPTERKRIEAGRGQCTEVIWEGKWRANVPREGQEKSETAGMHLLSTHYTTSPPFPSGLLPGLRGWFRGKGG